MKIILRACCGLLLCFALESCSQIGIMRSESMPDSGKHRLYLGGYSVDPYGGVKLPDHCYWEVVTTDRNGLIVLALSEKRSDHTVFQSVMSYLTPEEALQISEQLLNAATDCVDAPELDATAKEVSLDGQRMPRVIKPTINVEVPSVKLKDVALSEFLHTMLGPMGLDYEVRPGFVWISRPDVLAEGSSIPPEVLATVHLVDNESPDQLVEEVNEKLRCPVDVDFDDGIRIRQVLEFLSNNLELEFVLDERVMLPPDPYYFASPHELYLGRYKVLRGGVVRPPEACYWEAWTTFWRGEYRVLLELYDKKSELRGFSSVMSRLTPAEAADLSEQLKKAATECAREPGSQ